MVKPVNKALKLQDEGALKNNSISAGKRYNE
jgi:hypothetical protein